MIIFCLAIQITLAIATALIILSAELADRN